MATCVRCGTAARWVNCPTGGWWAHEVHPEDEHDAAPPPMELWEQARRELPDELPDSVARALRYRELMIEHGHLVVPDRGRLDLGLPEADSNG